MAPRSIWNGTITFGLVNVPIKLYSATESKTVHFSEVHVRDGAKIEHRRICPKEDKEVDYDEVVKGYEVEMAGRLVDSLHEDFKPERYEDSYREAVLDLVKRVAKGEDIDPMEQEEPQHGDDLSAALEASLGGGK